MKTDPPKSPDHSDLRQRAEKQLKAQPTPSIHAPPLEDFPKLVHELQVHQIELQMQNDELQRAKIDLETSLERYSDLYDFAPVGYFTFNEQGAILDANLTGATLLGEERLRLINRRFQIFVTPESRPVFSALLKTVYDRKAKHQCELQLLKKDEPSFWVELEATPVAFGQGHAKQCRTAVIDITARKRLQMVERQVSERLRQVQKLESLAVMAGGISHDFNNLLTVVLGNAELALMELEFTSAVCPYLRDIITTARRAADLSSQMLAYSGKGQLVIRPLDLSQLVKVMSPMLEAVVTKKSILRYDLAQTPLMALADTLQLRQVILNLVMNAVEAIGDREGAITVSTIATRYDRASLSTLEIDQPLPEGLYACLEVTDTGCGMDRETAAKIFDPFFTTKSAGRGLGLAVVQGIVRGHHGAIMVNSGPGKGTTVRILLPSVETPVAPAPHQTSTPPDWRGSGVVLLVDDEDLVRVLGKHLLERLGFSVLTAADGVEALAIFQSRAAEIACVLLDLTMPRMDGEETLRALRRLQPNVRVLLCSGYGEQQVASRVRDLNSVEFLQKPYQMAELAQKLHVLTRPS